MTEQPELSPHDHMTCAQCGNSTFYLQRSGTVSCDNCDRTYDLLAPEPAAPPGRPARPLGLARGESPNPLMRFREDWYFTFGLEHPLSGRYVKLHGTSESTREMMAAIFGAGNWAWQYDRGQIRPLIDRHGLTELNLSSPPPAARQPGPEPQPELGPE